MNRVKSFSGSGVPPAGFLYPTDLNAIQDAVAALSDLSQVFKAGEIHIGETGLAIVRYGPAEARLEGSFRVDNKLTAGTVALGNYTTAQRNLIATGLAPKGTVIFNTDLGYAEINRGTDSVRDWQGVSVLTYQVASLAADFNLTNANQFYDGPSVSLSAGTWQVYGQIYSSRTGGSGADVTVRVWDGITTYATTEFNAGGGGSTMGVAVLATTTTVKVSVACTSSFGTSGVVVRAAVPASPSGNNATRIIATRIG